MIEERETCFHIILWCEWCYNISNVVNFKTYLGLKVLLKEPSLYTLKLFKNYRKCLFQWLYHHLILFRHWNYVWMIFRMQIHFHKNSPSLIVVNFVSFNSYFTTKLCKVYILSKMVRNYGKLIHAFLERKVYRCFWIIK